MCINGSINNIQSIKKKEKQNRIVLVFPESVTVCYDPICIAGGDQGQETQGSTFAETVYNLH